MKLFTLPLLVASYAILAHADPGVSLAPAAVDILPSAMPRLPRQAAVAEAGARGSEGHAHILDNGAAEDLHTAGDAMGVFPMPLTARDAVPEAEAEADPSKISEHFKNFQADQKKKAQKINEHFKNFQADQAKKLKISNAKAKAGFEKFGSFLGKALPYVIDGLEVVGKLKRDPAAPTSAQAAKPVTTTTGPKTPPKSDSKTAASTPKTTTTPQKPGATTAAPALQSKPATSTTPPTPQGTGAASPNQPPPKLAAALDKMLAPKPKASTTVPAKGAPTTTKPEDKADAHWAEFEKALEGYADKKGPDSHEDLAKIANLLPKVAPRSLEDDASRPRGAKFRY